MNGVILSMDQIRTYQYDTEGTLDMTIEIEGEIRVTKTLTQIYN